LLVDKLFEVSNTIGDLAWWWRHEMGVSWPGATDPVLTRSKLAWPFVTAASL